MWQDAAKEGCGTVDEGPSPHVGVPGAPYFFLLLNVTT